MNAVKFTPLVVIADALTGGIAKQFPDKFIAQAK